MAGDEPGQVKGIFNLYNMTADSNAGVYKILRMVRDTTCSSDVISQWVSSNSQEKLEGFICTVEDKTGKLRDSV